MDGIILRKELEVRYATQKSFYGKATMMHQDEKLVLISYSTIVATIENGIATVFGTYSPTTLRHIKEFLKQNGFTADTKRQIENDYMRGGC
jgi:hypothetical protein